MNSRTPSIAAVILAAALLGACAGSERTATTEPASTSLSPSTTVVVTTTTEAQLSTADEPLVRCDNAAFRETFGEKMRMNLCTGNWASGNSDRDTWNCPDAGCRQVRLYTRGDGTWRATATCDTRYPLTLWKVSCFRPDLQPVTVADIPSPSIQCRIWPTNVQLRNVSETGCEPPQSVINEATRGKCTRWTENLRLPLEKCDSGRVVKILQRRLVALGYDMEIDNYLGPGVVSAIMDFQKKNSIFATGLVDLATWKALFPSNEGLKGTDSDGDGVITPDELS